MADEPETPIQAMNDFRQQLLEMAARELGDTLPQVAGEDATPTDERFVARVTRRLPRRRLTLALAALLVAAAAAAGASQLISTGTPALGPAYPDQYRPGSASPALVVIAADKAFHQPWGVQIYDSADGQECARAGQVRGRDLGIVRGGRFHKYAENASGVCRDLKRGQVVFDDLDIPSSPARSLVFGRVAAPGSRVQLQNAGRTFSTRAAQGGAFLFVLDSRPAELLRITALDRAGRVVDR